MIDTEDLAEEQKNRIAEIKRRLIESIDFCNEWEAQERAKREAQETPIQGKDEEDSEEGSIE